MLIWHAGRGRLRTGATLTETNPAVFRSRTMPEQIPIKLCCKLQGWIRRTDRMQRWISGLRLLERFGMSKPLACTMLREIAPPSFWHAKATVAPRRESPVLARMQCSEPSAYPLAFLNGSRDRIAHFAIHASSVGIPSGFAECGIKGDNPRGRRPPCGTPWGCATPHPTNASTWAHGTAVIAHRFGPFQEGVVSCTCAVGSSNGLHALDINGTAAADATRTRSAPSLVGPSDTLARLK